MTFTEEDIALPIRVELRIYYSRYHLWAAQHFTRLAFELETAHTGKANFSPSHRSYVTSAVLSAVGFLEAAINEVLTDIAEGRETYIKPLEPETRRLLAGLWNEGNGRSISRWSILEKYQVALHCAGKAQFTKGGPPYQDASWLIDLRNLLVHARPESFGTDDLNDISKKLRGKFDANKLMAESPNAYFPDHCLGAGCAAWAVKSSKALADEFVDRLGISPPYDISSYGPP